jgi:sulfate adenylyltransferase
MASARTCPHPPEARASLSGTQVRELLARGEPLPPEFSRPEVAEVLRRALVEA